MNLLYALLLGILQGATEFLPVSSSGHLALAEHFLGVTGAGLTFDVALHLGTLIAVLIYFRLDFFLMVRALFFPQAAGPDGPVHRRLFWMICLATIPGVIAGVLLEKQAETVFRHPLLIAATLAGVGGFLLLAERIGGRQRKFGELKFADAIIIGLSQSLAIIPGVSRSGITMVSGLFRGLDREAAARFSFLLSTPIILGAGVYHLPAIVQQGEGAGQLPFFLGGFLASAISGYVVIAWLLRYLKTRTLNIFAYYRLGLAGLVCVVFYI
ncbi:MAG: undecaprenyl-diphosphatase UppP [Proteobacteria bacterium]|nr:undecaprenyl-diphosphatase UppP [Pseudomonadota bacterium]MBU1687920.1 undecaprenyl-diphosphatase UppP [Pseudomonadota bacterium]